MDSADKFIALPPHATKALTETFTWLLLMAQRDEDFLRCLPVSAQDRWLDRTRIAIRTHLLMDRGISADLGSALAAAYSQGLIFRIATPTTGRAPHFQEELHDDPE